MSKDIQSYENMLLGDTLIKLAVEKTGLNDWGNESFQEPLTMFLQSFEEEHMPTTEERKRVAEECLFLLTTRLQVIDDLKRYPQILQVPVTRPLFIVGLERTGTTLLHNIVSQSKDFKWLEYWELLNPSPPPDVHTGNKDPRIRITELLIKRIEGISPFLCQAHNLSARNPEECYWILRHTFMQKYIVGNYNLTTFTQWLLTRDMSPAYKYYRSVLQLLSYKSSARHLALKSPTHLFALEGLLKVFPDANIVWTHRSPLEAIPSYCSLRSKFDLQEKIPPEQVNDILSWASASVIYALKARDKAKPSQFFDVAYEELVRDPIGIAQRIFKHFGYDYSMETENSIKKWIAENPQNKHGVHNYSMEKFGLCSEKVKEAFSYYCKRFNL